MTIPLMADDTVGLIHALGLDAPTLLGWSMGAEIGLTVAALHPGVLTRLVTSGGDAGSPHAVQARPDVQRELDDPATTPAQVLDLLFPASAAAAKQAFVGQYLLVPQQSAESAGPARAIRSRVGLRGRSPHVGRPAGHIDTRPRHARQRRRRRAAGQR